MGDCLCGCRPGEEFCQRRDWVGREYKDAMAGVDAAADADYVDMMREAHDAVEDKIGDVPGEARWVNALGEEVDLDNIDAEYALNIYTMVCTRRGALGYTDSEMRSDPLVQKLREVILTGRDRNTHDKLRARRYNIMCRFRGLPFRAR